MTALLTLIIAAMSGSVAAEQMTQTTELQVVVGAEGSQEECSTCEHAILARNDAAEGLHTNWHSAPVLGGSATAEGQNATAQSVKTLATKNPVDQERQPLSSRQRETEERIAAKVAAVSVYTFLPRGTREDFSSVITAFNLYHDDIYTATAVQDNLSSS